MPTSSWRRALSPAGVAGRRLLAACRVRLVSKQPLHAWLVVTSPTTGHTTTSGSTLNRMFACSAAAWGRHMVASPPAGPGCNGAAATVPSSPVDGRSSPPGAPAGQPPTPAQHTALDAAQPARATHECTPAIQHGAGAYAPMHVTASDSSTTLQPPAAALHASPAGSASGSCLGMPHLAVGQSPWCAMSQGEAQQETRASLQATPGLSPVEQLAGALQELSCTSPGMPMLTHRSCTIRLALARGRH
jgi:hypothetical protein